MLVSAIARFNAINTMNNAAYNMMYATNYMSSMMHSNTFGGEHSLSMLHEADKKISLDLASNSLLYQIAYLQERNFAKRQAQEFKQNKLNVMG